MLAQGIPRSAQGFTTVCWNAMQRLAQGFLLRGVAKIAFKQIRSRKSENTSFGEPRVWAGGQRRACARSFHAARKGRARVRARVAYLKCLGGLTFKSGWTVTCICVPLCIQSDRHSPWQVNCNIMYNWLWDHRWRNTLRGTTILA